MINLVSKRTFFELPFPHVEISGVIDQEVARQLTQSFPRNLHRSEREIGSDKTYVVTNRRILEVDGTRKTRSVIWNELLNAVLSSGYRDWLSEICGTSLHDAKVEVDLNAYNTGGFMSAHTDRSHKVVSHIIYLAAHWVEDWGGGLTLFDNPEGEAVRRIMPRWPNSVVIPRSDQSWHAVAPVKLSPLRRLTIQISFWRDSPRQSSPELDGFSIIGQCR